MGMKVNELKKGHVIKEDGELWQIFEIDNIKPGKGSAYYQVKKKSLVNGRIVLNRYTSGSTVDFAFLETKELQYSWKDGDSFVFLDTDSYEQFTIGADQIGELMLYVKPNECITAKFYEGKAVTVELPLVVQLAVADTEPAAKGDTVNNVYKPATLETGLEIKVPLFIAIGDIVKVQTSSGEFSGRVVQK
jgi:elongation factor P